MTSPKGQLAQFRAFELQQFEKSPSPMCVFDRETQRCLAVNDAALRLYGYARDEFLGLVPGDTRHPDDDFGFERGGGSTLPRHCGLRRHIKRSGDVFLADMVVQDILFEDRQAHLILLLDRPERTRVNTTRTARDQLFDALVEHSPDVIARIDRELRHLYVNPAAETATGISPRQLIGGNHPRAVPPELCTRWAAAVRRVFATGRQQELDI